METLSKIRESLKFLFLSAFSLVLTTVFLWAQNGPDDHGVADWQAKRAIVEYVDRFVAAQNEFGLAKFGSENFSVRVRIEGVNRLYNEETGWQWFAQFTGAILPDVANAGAKQGYAHGVLHIYRDPERGVLLVANGGQNLWVETMETEHLYRLLPEHPGNWKDWGGPGEDPDPDTRALDFGDDAVEPSPRDSAPPNPVLIPDRSKTPQGGNDKVIALANEMKALDAEIKYKLDNNIVEGLQQLQERKQQLVDLKQPSAHVDKHKVGDKT